MGWALAPCLPQTGAQQFLPPSLSRHEVRPTDSALTLCSPPGSLHSSYHAPVLSLLSLLQAHSLPLRCRLLAGALHLVDVVMKALMAPLAPWRGNIHQIRKCVLRLGWRSHHSLASPAFRKGAWVQLTVLIRDWGGNKAGRGFGQPSQRSLACGVLIKEHPWDQLPWEGGKGSRSGQRKKERCDAGPLSTHAPELGARCSWGITGGLLGAGCPQAAHPAFGQQVLP